MSYTNPPYYISAYALAQKRGFRGTLDEWLDSLTAYYLVQQAGYTGTREDWLKKLIDPIPKIKIGTVKTLDGGKNATVEVSGTPEEPVLSFGIPRGMGMVDALALLGGTMKGAIDMSGFGIINLPEPENNGDAVPKEFVDESLQIVGEAVTAAMGQATTARSAANSAQTTADNAQTAANNAQTTANNANKAASNAVSHANTEVRKASPRNLLDNSDFRNPVNQRGITTSSAAGYTLDRWVNTYVRPNWTVNTGYVTLKNDSTTDGYRVYQRFEKGTLKAGTKYTAAIKLRTAGVLFAVIEAPDSGDKYSSKLKDLIYLGLSKSTSYDAFYVSVTSGNTVNVEWAALYEGEYTADTLPEYQPKGYGVELTECMRYFQTIKSAGSGYFTPIGFGWGTSATVGRCAIPLPAPMRDGLAASIEKNTFTGMYLFDGSERGVSELSVINTTSKVPTNVVVVDATVDGIGNRAPCSLVVTSGEIWLSKDL